MGIFSKAKERLGGRGKSPAARPGQDNVPAPSTRPDSLSVPSTATLVVGRSSTGSNAAAGERLTHAAKVNTDERTDESLWDRAYRALDPDMVADYDAVLAEVVKEQDETMDGAGTRAVQEQVDEASQRGKTAYEAKKLQYSIFNKTLVASKLTSDAVALINRFKPIVDEAVKASAAASFAWAGVSLALGILANPQGVHEENLDGLAKVTSAMHYYTEIEPLLLRQKQDHGTAAGVYREIEKLVVDLYTNILDFECRSALRFYCPRLRRVWKDMRRADDWKAMLSKIETSEAVLKDRSTQVLALIATDDQRAAAKRAADILADARQQLKQLKAQTETLHAMLDLEKKKELFEKVPLVPGALYSSYEDRAIPQCQEDTRVATLEEIEGWIQIPGARGVFWLSGPAGSGKSTISKTVAASLDSSGRLAASYFFRQPDRCMADKVFSTIARQLVEKIPGFGVELYKSLETANTPISKFRHNLQCKMLITDPLSGLGSVQEERNGSNAPMVIVVDGLDECDSDIEALCNLLCSLPDAMPGRLLIFLASRDVRSIADPIATRDHRTYAHLDLRRKTEESVSDITAFVTREFNKMAKKRRNNAVLTDGETLSRVIALCTKPSPLFVFASTLCRSVSRNTSPSYQLNKWLNDRKNTAPESRLDELYASVIRQALFGDDGCTRYDESQRSDILTIIGSLMFLSRPQSSASLAALLGMDPDYVNDMLDDFRPVLNIPDNDKEPIQILHTSFVEFMRGHTVADLQDFVSNEDAMHSTLLQSCIVYMGENLKKDLCELGDPATSITDVDQSVLDTHIPAALQYACLFWSRHITKTDESALSTVLCFLKDHLLHWLEAMALLGKIIDAASSMWELATWVTGELSQFIDDIIAFLDAYGIIIIREFPLQVYGSALIWCPTSNMVRSTQWKHRLLVIESAVSNANNIELRPSPREGHKVNIKAVAFSPKSDFLASCLDDGTVWLWNTKTRHCIEVVRIGMRVTSVAYSSDGETLATASDCIHLWNSSDRELKRSFGLDGVEPIAIVFVPGTEDLVAYMTDDTVRAWDYKTGEAREHYGTMEMDEARELDMDFFPRRLAVSPNGRLLAGAVNHIVVLFDAQTLSVLHKWKISTGYKLTFLGFAQDSQTVIVASATWGVHAWSTTSYRSRLQLDIHPKHKWVGSALSSDGRLFAFRDLETVSVYAMDDVLAQAEYGPVVLKKVMPLLVHNTGDDMFRTPPWLCFSPNSRQLAVPGRDRVTLLDVPRCRQTVEDEEYDARLIILRNRQMFVTLSFGLVAVWSVADCQCQFAIRCQPFCADLSPDGQYLAVGAYDGVGLFPLTKAESASTTSASAAADAVGADERRVRLDVDRNVDGAEGLVNHDGSVDSMAFSANSQALAVGYHGSVIRLWNVVTQKHTSTRRVASYAQNIANLAFSEDNLLLAAGLESEIRVYKVGEMGLGPVLKVVKTDADLRHVYFRHVYKFWPDNRYLDTGSALVDLEKCSVNSSESRPRPPGMVYLVDRWLVRDGVHLLWLPNDSYEWPSIFQDPIDRVVLPYGRGGLVVITLMPSSQGTGESTRV